MQSETSHTPFLSSVWTHLTTFQPVRGEGIYLFDSEGKRYTDFTSGIGVTSTGHCHPKVVGAIQEQAGKLIFGQMNCVIPDVTVRLSQKLKTITPPGIDRFFFANSGSEATEAAVNWGGTEASCYCFFRSSTVVRTWQWQDHFQTTYRHNYQPCSCSLHFLFLLLWVGRRDNRRFLYQTIRPAAARADGAG
jgi:hypothetical protein